MPPTSEPQAPAGTVVDDRSGKLILPGFIDAHIHYPQTRVIGSYGAQLLDWLQKYTFVEEQKFSDPAHAAAVADFFLDEMFRQGTTTAVVYCTVRPKLVEAFFVASERRGARMIAGKVMMDRNAPPALTDTPQRGYDESKALIERWHGRGRLEYAITPRFAITSSDAQLAAAGAWRANFRLLRADPSQRKPRRDRLTKQFFPRRATISTSTTASACVGPKSIFGHCIHLEEAEVADAGGKARGRRVLPDVEPVPRFGAVRHRRLDEAGVRVALATDVGGGTSYSMLQTAQRRLQGAADARPVVAGDSGLLSADARQRARAKTQDKIGKLEAGQEAD